MASVQCDALKFDFRMSAVRLLFITWVRYALKKIITSKQKVSIFFRKPRALRFS